MAVSRVGAGAGWEKSALISSDSAIDKDKQNRPRTKTRVFMLTDSINSAHYWNEVFTLFAKTGL